ncbi:MAG: hypothetical protein ACP5OG_02190 [Candidatus Nanoarchaeia archaeon]
MKNSIITISLVIAIVVSMMFVGGCGSRAQVNAKNKKMHSLLANESKLNEKKYELTKEMLKYEQYKLYRIKALKDFSDVKAGDLGGYVEYPSNLSQQGDCWIYDTSKVYKGGFIGENAKVMEKSSVYNGSLICGNAIIKNASNIYGSNLGVSGNKVVSGSNIKGYGWLPMSISDRKNCYYDCGDQKIKEQAKFFADLGNNVLMVPFIVVGFPIKVISGILEE